MPIVKSMLAAVLGATAASAVVPTQAWSADDVATQIVTICVATSSADHACVGTTALAAVAPRTAASIDFTIGIGDSPSDCLMYSGYGFSRSPVRSDAGQRPGVASN